METREKIWVMIAAAMILGLAFIAGQFFFYNRQNQILPSPSPAAKNLGAKLPQLTKENLVLVAGDKKFNVKPQELEMWVESYFRSWTGRQEYRLNREKIEPYLKTISKEIDTAPVNARFSIKNTGEITEFVPSQRGQILNIPESLEIITSALLSDYASDKSIELAVDKIEPQITLDKVNSLGINTLLGRGESNFAGSSSSRVRNIQRGAEILSGTLLKPGEEFSFNRVIGTIGASSGYSPELIIKGGKLVPEYGGGLCQVSTTLFRAVMAAGLAVLERHPHSMPVRYYNPQGFDATIYPGVSDFRFKNDTPSYILLQSKIAGSKLSFEIYGTDDGRKATIDGPYEYGLEANGAFKTVLRRTIAYSDGTEKKEAFYSSYKPPSTSPAIRNPLE
jgi:vancomycin resistance protein YoaR